MAELEEALDAKELLAAGGGSGGASGACFLCEGPVSYFGGSTTVTIGAGGTGGVTQGSNNSDGSPGGVCNQSVFGNMNAVVQATSNGIAGTNGTTGVPVSGRLFQYSSTILTPGGGAGTGANAAGGNVTTPFAGGAALTWIFPSSVVEERAQILEQLEGEALCC